jgi:hypothetical protein
MQLSSFVVTNKTNSVVACKDDVEKPVPCDNCPNYFCGNASVNFKNSKLFIFF